MEQAAPVKTTRAFIDTSKNMVLSSNVTTENATHHIGCNCDGVRKISCHKECHCMKYINLSAAISI